MEDIISSKLLIRAAHGKGLKISHTEAMGILFQIETELCKFLIGKQAMMKNTLKVECSSSSIKQLADSISDDSLYDTNIDKFLSDRIGRYPAVNLKRTLPTVIASIVFNVLSSKQKGTNLIR